MAGGSFALRAIASSKVDFPDPFSPTKKVTGVVTFRAENEVGAGTENG